MKYLLLFVSLLTTSVIFSMENEETIVKDAAQEFNIKTNAKTKNDAIFEARQRILNLRNTKIVPRLLGNTGLVIGGGIVTASCFFPYLAAIYSGLLGIDAREKGPSAEGLKKAGYLFAGIFGGVGLIGTLCGGAAMAIGVRNIWRWLPKNFARRRDAEISNLTNYVREIEMKQS
jgi:hypothetical protein